ncbi:hydantoinase/oxoprolinase family protein [Persephonella sp.]
MVKVGIDTGGTFTDFVYSINGKWKVLKVLSTPADPSEAVLTGLKKIKADRFDVTHGSTVATNAVLERKGAKTAFITNRGFEDIIYIGRQSRKRLYDLHYRRPKPLVPEELRIGLDCRVNSKGEIIKKLNREEVVQTARQLKEKGVEAVAVSLLFSFLNPEHEKEIKEVFKHHGFYVSVSHEIVPEFREFERSSTTVINSYVMPKMEKYISRIQKKLPEGSRFRIIQSNGGVISPETAKKEPVRTVLSGPAGGVVGAYTVGKAVGKTKLITFDMGGTSTDVSLIDGSIPFSTDTEIEGMPIKVPVIDIHTVGAGGGSIAYLDEGGALNVGPESAGADPGPVCYGRGEKLTVTDANLLLGRLQPEFFLGGNMKLHTDRLKRYFEKYSSEWEIPPVQLAEGILNIANTKMERAVRVISIEKGYNPKEFALFTYGGAGGLHAAFLARNLSIPEVIVPENPGIFSAFGMLMADVIKDYSLTVMYTAGSKAESHIEKMFALLEERAVKDMENEGFKRENIHLEKMLDLRYKGQSFEIVVPFAHNFVESFHIKHRHIYGYSRPDRPVEVVNIRVRAVGEREKPVLKKYQLESEKIPDTAVLTRKELIFEGKKYKTVILDRKRLNAGNIIKGPAVIVEYSSTTVVPPFAEAHIDQYRNIIIKIS